MHIVMCDERQEVEMAERVAWPMVRWIRCPVCQAECDPPAKKIDPGCNLCMGDGMVMQRLDHPRAGRPIELVAPEDDTPEAA
jgi:hypothetical protein